MHLRYLIEPVCVQYGRLFSQKNAFRIQRSRAQERGLSRGNLSPLTRFWFGVPDGSQDPMGRGGRTAAGRAARSVTEGQHDSSGGCARRAPAATLGAILCAVRIDFRLPSKINPYPAQPATGVLGQSPKRVLLTFARTKVSPRRVGVQSITFYKTFPTGGDYKLFHAHLPVGGKRKKPGGTGLSLWTARPRAHPRLRSALRE